MRRIYVLLPNAKSATRIIDELLLKRVEWRHVHVLAAPGVRTGDLPKATLAQRSDLLPALARGTAVGWFTGVVIGLAALVFHPEGLKFGAGAVVLITLISAGFGAWTATMIGVDVPNTRLKRFEGAVEKGELLMMVDVKTDRVDEIEALIKKHHPEADVEGHDPTIPAFP
ncbi:hypothetical protein WI73_00440 [Burkholderia ubonensis]|uniref:Uncharacterized protein n=1 Tax=Burkholderia ubonensis TaxID=101571 RepID=A0A102N7W9_9BURK|nr:hypothetical protein [Burkholderia ubonensis]AOI70104.1 hypothetical protein WI31_11410 [Burkholderia ubonensis]KUZ25643.1 hypothetical protein WI29_08205 [Burkholderia ubonensis]KUZ26013.1 hypothetical protein WI30_25810 [Burkholderia ubonensis]KUZ27800.1 hypothetical protein WI32_27750 [Burkholderia ubonensis]KUZ57731.1 hypothetical protein WI33_03075 [Burkholderia ubonensis]